MPPFDRNISPTMLIPSLDGRHLRRCKNPSTRCEQISKVPIAISLSGVVPGIEVKNDSARCDLGVIPKIY
jgi:hypothetical protein